MDKKEDKDLQEAFDDLYRYTIIMGVKFNWNIIAAENNTVVGTMTSKGKSIYDKDYNQIYCQIFTIKDNKIYKLHEFFDTSLVETSLFNKEYKVR